MTENKFTQLYISSAEASQILGVSQPTFRRLAREYEVKTVQPGAVKRLYYRGDVEQLFDRIGKPKEIQICADSTKPLSLDKYGN
jgi:excisionase family DNA binding protein